MPFSTASSTDSAAPPAPMAMPSGSRSQFVGMPAMISNTSTKNISPRGTHRMAAPSVAAAITVTASRTPSTATGACAAE